MNKTKEAQASISDSFLQNFPDLTLSLNGKGEILEANAHASTLLGYTAEEMKGKKVHDFFFDSYGKEKASSKSFEYRLKTKQGNLVPVEIRSFPTGHADAPTVLILRDLRDVTQARASLFHDGKFAAMNELSPSLIHDIRNSLSILGAQHYFMKHNVDKLDTAKFLAGLDIIQKASLKIEKITNQLRDLIHAEEVLCEVHARDLLEKCIFLLEPRTRKTDTMIHNQIPIDVQLKCVPLQVEQVFLHLLDNAVDALANREEKTIRVDATQTQDSLVFTVRDSGSGIEAKIKDQVFDPFFTTKPKGEGTGLGLYVCKQILTRHGGSLKMESEEGKGTTFMVTFPK